MEKGLDLRESRIKLQFRGADLVFARPYAGRGTYSQIMSQLEERGLDKPTFFETVVLVNAAWQNPNEKSSKEILYLMVHHSLVTDTGLLYVPKKGVYIQDHPDTNENGWANMDEETLASKLKDGDPNVRFAPFGYKKGKMSTKQLAASRYSKALCGGKENAALLAEVASKYRDKPYTYTYSIDEVSKPETRVAALLSDYQDGWFYVCGHILESFGDGFAHGLANERSELTTL